MKLKKWHVCLRWGWRKKRGLYYLLGFFLFFYLFLSGGVVLGASYNPLPDTGQHKCYNNSAEMVCPAPNDSMAQDGTYDIAQGKIQPAFSDNGDGTVTDNNIGLMWQKDTADINGDNIINNSDELTWQNAVNYCEGLNFAGYDDWRLPAIFELCTITNYGLAEPSINSASSSEFSTYWSSTVFVAYSDSAWGLTRYGADYSMGTSFTSYVRCVRGGLRTLGPYIDNGDGTVTDSGTGLMWQKETADINGDDVYNSSDEVTWKNAISYCEGLVLGGYNDWRLPDIQELRSLVDYSRSSPAIDTSVFQCFEPTYWTSTTTVGIGPSFAWNITFLHGEDGASRKEYPGYVRCVRGGLVSVVQLNISITGNGSGIVKDSAGEINCGIDCLGFYPSNSNIVLSATPETNSLFSGWSGDCTGNSSSLSLTMDGYKSCTATFNLKQYTLTPTSTPSSGGSINCSPNPVDHGSSSTCTITPNGGYTLTEVSGTCGGTLNGNTYTTNVITSDCTVEAQFNIADDDGIPASIEDSAPNNGDGNGDGIRDSLQSNVASFPSVTLEAPVNCNVNNMQLLSEQEVSSEDSEYSFPYGLLQFRLACSEAKVKIYFHSTGDLSGYVYRKYGPVPPSFSNSKWYTLSQVIFDTEEIAGNRVAYAEFTLRDGELGDDTPADGYIVDAGGPAVSEDNVSEEVTIPTLTEWGFIFFTLFVGIVAIINIKHRQIRIK